MQLVLAVGARLPRIFTGLLVGAALGIAGCLTQTLAGNRLATPDLVGVDEGAAAAGSATGMVGNRWLGPIGAVAAAVLVALCAGGAEGAGSRLLVTGIGISTFIGAVSDLIMSRENDNTARCAAAAVTARPRRSRRTPAPAPWGAQSPRAPEAVTVAGLVRYGRSPHQGLLRQWSRQDERAVRETLDATGTTAPAGERPDRLSGGQRRRCRLAMAPAQQTPLVLLDEPTSTLDLGHAVVVLELVREGAATRPHRRGRVTADTCPLTS
ncbi:iron chelate uptake ABC transporter family permease subunit [Streptomyces sp. NBC_01220]|uniref:iron chelate uptake ABC transporter family permease subunit n=1 Tax=Streptomyces sp. NBC_01220 TaxID=2903781 RepID=UPI00352D5629|nr:iron chelate uptake ABC transporter family permease subunit [Streptomyces sp. NBC_01220]